MRRTAFFAFTAITLYLAAMYRSASLMLLFLTDLFLAVCMWAIAHYLKRYLAVELPKRSVVEEKGAEYWCGYDVVNRGRLPVSRYRIRVRVRYLQENRGTIKSLYGTSGSGKEGKHFGVCVPYCGMVCLEFDRLWVYDYLGLFSGQNLLRQEMRLAILPSEQPLKIKVSSFEWDSGNEGQEKAARYNGDVVDEVMQIREYRPGDSIRYIHWNQSAKTDRIWIKEYEKEVNSCMALLLEINISRWNNPKDMDAFYRLLYAVLSGLLQKADRVRVYWYDGHPGNLAEMEILDEIQCRDMFLRLCQINFSKLPVLDEKTLLGEFPFTHGRYFKLDTGLRWYLNEDLIYHFSAKALEQEIATKEFTL